MSNIFAQYSRARKELEQKVENELMEQYPLTGEGGKEIEVTVIHTWKNGELSSVLQHSYPPCIHNLELAVGEAKNKEEAW